MKIIFLFYILLNSQELKRSFLTIYSDNFATVSQEYSLNCNKGQNLINLSGMPRTIVPESLSIFVPKDIYVLMYNYKSDDEGYINHKVEILTKDNSIIKATILRDGEFIVALDEKGNYLKINKEYVKQINYFSFNEKDYRRKIRNSASISFQMNSKDKKDCLFNIRYVINSINWSCNYDAYINDTETSLDIKARVNIVNNTGHDFKNSSLMLIAGSMNRVQDQPQIFRAMAKSLETAGDFINSEIKPQEIVESYSYKIPFDNITLNDGENISVELFSKTGIKFDKYYVYKGQIDNWYFYDNIKSYKYDKKLNTIFSFKNNKENSFDIPLPEGKIRIYKMKDGFNVFSGEDLIKNTPLNSKIEINSGKAFDVEGERRILEHKKVLPNIYRDTIEIKIRNEKKEEISVKVKEYLWGRWKIVESSHRYNQIDANNIEFDIKVSPKSSQVIKYTAEYDFNN